MLPSCSRRPDKYGRRAVLIVILVLMGLLPTYATIGV